MSNEDRLWLNSEKVSELSKTMTCGELGALMLLAVQNCQNGSLTRDELYDCESGKIRRMFKVIDGERYTLPWLAKLIQKEDPYAAKEDEKGGGDA